MMFKTHLAFSILTALLIIILFDIPEKLLFIAVLVFSSSLPDIDSKKSKIGRKFPLFSKIINLIFGHRGFFHSVFPPIIALAMLWYLNLFLLGLAVFIGYLTHLILDATTIEGINFLYPVSKYRIKGLIRTNSFSEFIIFLLISSLNLILLYRIYL